MMRYIRTHPGWDFILAQKKKTYFQTSAGSWVYLADLVIKPRQPIYRSNLTWTKKHPYPSVNFFAFYAPHQSGPTGPKPGDRGGSGGDPADGAQPADSPGGVHSQ
jgi:hypothetical protein